MLVSSSLKAAASRLRNPAIQFAAERTMRSVVIPPSTRAFSIELTDRAKERIVSLRKQKNQPSLQLRLSVEGGGCSGFSYKFSTFEGSPEKDDLLLGGDPPIVIDPDSLEFVKGAKIDFTEDLIKRSFEVVDNPQVETKCGCGTSFAPKTGKSK